MNKVPKVSVLIPVYNGAGVIGETLNCIFGQDFKDYEVVIVDDTSTDNSEEVIKSISDPRVRYFRNPQNLGYSRNLEECRTKARGDILFLMGQDDILAKGALKKTIAWFDDPEIGAVTRPYFWFHDDPQKPVRAKKQFSSQKDEILSITDGPKTLVNVLDPLDQLSGLAYRVEFMDCGFHEDIFPCHIYPFLSIFKRHEIVFLRDYTIAVRIASSQTRSISSIYKKSPIQTWVDMINSVLCEDRFVEFRRYAIENFIAKNYVGLVQIRNYGRYRWLLREIYLLLKYRWQNLFSPAFWFFSLGCMVIPPALLIPLVDWYKNSVNSQRFGNIKFEYEL